MNNNRESSKPANPRFKVLGLVMIILLTSLACSRENVSMPEATHWVRCALGLDYCDDKPPLIGKNARDNKDSVPFIPKKPTEIGSNSDSEPQPVEEIYSAIEYIDFYGPRCDEAEGTYEFKWSVNLAHEVSLNFWAGESNITIAPAAEGCSTGLWARINRVM